MATSAGKYVGGLTRSPDGLSCIIVSQIFGFSTLPACHSSIALDPLKFSSFSARFSQVSRNFLFFSYRSLFLTINVLFHFGRISKFSFKSSSRSLSAQTGNPGKGGFIPCMKTFHTSINAFISLLNPYFFRSTSESFCKISSTSHCKPGVPWKLKIGTSPRSARWHKMKTRSRCCGTPMKCGLKIIGEELTEYPMSTRFS